MHTSSMDFECYQSSSSSSSSPKTLTPTTKHKKKAGRKIFKETRHPVYRGVRRKKGGKWVCEVRVPNKKSRIWLGTFLEPETAAVAHDVAALALRGDYAPLNFPDSASRLPRVASSSHQDIRRAAFQAARDFAPSFRFSHANQLQNSSSGTSDEKDEFEIYNRIDFMCDRRNKERVSEGDDSGVVGGFVDEEAVFNMPVLLDSMAEGLLLTPLAMQKGFNWSQYEVDDCLELSLWDDLN